MWTKIQNGANIVKINLYYFIIYSPENPMNMTNFFIKIPFYTCKNNIFVILTIEKQKKSFFSSDKKGVQTQQCDYPKYVLE
jgi:hypothetical protein